MRSSPLKIFILIISCCFFTSATETEIGSCHQTFFDDYDTYIPAEKVLQQSLAKQVSPQKKVLPLYNQLSTFNGVSFLQSRQYDCKATCHWLSAGTRKIFLYNSVFLI